MPHTYSYLFFSIFFFFVFCYPKKASSQQDILDVEGVYNGQNIYIYNPLKPPRDTICVTGYRINGEYSKAPNESTFELMVKNINIGDSLKIEILYHCGCHPQVITPNTLNPQVTFKLIKLKVIDDTLLTWISCCETGKLPFEIEHFKWNRWYLIGEVLGNGKKDTIQYEFPFKPTSGKNQLRIKQTPCLGRSKTSKTVEYISRLKPVELYFYKEPLIILFSDLTSFELYNVYGDVINEGRAKYVDFHDLKDRHYYLNYDDKNIELFVKNGTFKMKDIGRKTHRPILKGKKIHQSKEKLENRISNLIMQLQKSMHF